MARTDQFNVPRALESLLERGRIGTGNIANYGEQLVQDAPQAWAQQVPAELLSSLPWDGTTGDDARRDPSRTLHFSYAGRLYRVARSIACAATSECQFRLLSVAEAAEPASGECAVGMLNCTTQIFPDGRRVTKRIDSELTRTSGRLWPRGGREVA